MEVVTCDDGGSGVGSKECVQRLLDKDPAKRVFALVAGASLDYAGAKRVSEAGVRDIGGRPVGPAYDTYPHLYGIYGSLAPRDGRRPGWGEKVHGGTEVYRCFKREQGASKAAVVSYDQSASTGYARLVTRGLKEEGYDVIEEQGDFALPNFRAVAADLRAQKVDLVTFDAMETHGNAQLCEAIDGARGAADRQGHQQEGDEAHGSRPRAALPAAVRRVGRGDVVQRRGEIVRRPAHPSVCGALHGEGQALCDARTAASRDLRAPCPTAEGAAHLSVRRALAGRQGPAGADRGRVAT